MTQTPTTCTSRQASVRRPGEGSPAQKDSDRAPRQGHARLVALPDPAPLAPRARLEDLVRPSVLSRLTALEDLVFLFGPRSPEARAAKRASAIHAVPEGQ